MGHTQKYRPRLFLNGLSTRARTSSLVQIGAEKGIFGQGWGPEEAAKTNSKDTFPNKVRGQVCDIKT